ncbi:MAG: glycosyltransferase family 2 protein [Eubacteriales bacterium]|nr:glycosyltransferase family 2 protein [Lachnospiraceae bacterium]MDO5127254.1 glycosyltransferase family 2 protein [Eubacteriales bacterium]
MTDTFVACIITYNPNLNRLIENIDSICPQVSRVIIVDNGSDNFEELSGRLLHYKSVILHASKVNRGIARALNKGFSIAEGEHATWVLTLDQDSVCPPYMISNYKNYLAKLHKHTPAEKVSRIGILCPTIVDRNIGVIAAEESHTGPVKKCITSGALTSYSAWKAIGGFDEKMFIDGVDFEFCERLIQHNYYIIRVADIALLHELGQMTTKRILCKTIQVKNHPAFRKYYIVRNRLYVARKHKKPFSVTRAYMSAIKTAFIVLFFEDHKKEKLSAIRKGIADSRNM